MKTKTQKQTEAEEMASILGFESVQAMQDHQDWIIKNGSPEFLEWIAQVKEAE